MVGDVEKAQAVQDLRKGPSDRIGEAMRLAWPLCFGETAAATGITVRFNYHLRCSASDNYVVPKLI